MFLELGHVLQRDAKVVRYLPRLQEWLKFFWCWIFVCTHMFLIMTESAVMLRDFSASLSRRGMRPASIVKYMQTARSWTGFLERRSVSVATAGRVDVETWLDAHPAGVRARCTKISALHMFYVWAQRTSHASHDPTALVERPRLDRRLPRPARMAAVDMSMRAARPEVRLMMCLMADGGLRCCEVSALRWVDVDLVARTMHISGKGGRDRVVGIPRRLLRELSRSDAVVGYVIGRYLTPARVSQIVGGHLRGSGVPATAHQLRHLYATRLYAATGGDLLTVQLALGHASVTSTQIYAAIDPGRALDAAQRLDGREK